MPLKNQLLKKLAIDKNWRVFKVNLVKGRRLKSPYIIVVI